MSYIQFWKECSCWCLFSLSTVMLLIMSILVLNDMSMLSKHEAMLQQIINIPIPQLNCVHICQSWYSMESGVQCCDRYNMNLCTAKQHCKKEYVKKTQSVMQILQNDKFHETSIAGVCILILVMIACRKRWEVISEESEENKSAKMKDLVKQVLQQLKKQKMIESAPHFPSDEIIPTPITQISNPQILQKNQSNVKLMMENEKELACHSQKEKRNQEYQSCHSTTIQTMNESK